MNSTALRSWSGVLSALTLMLMAGAPASALGPDDKPKNPIFRAAERATQRAAEKKPESRPSQPAAAPRAASEPRPTASRPSSGGEKSSVLRTVEAARQSQERRASEPRKESSQPPVVTRPAQPTRTETAQPRTNTSEPSKNPIYRAAERARSTTGQRTNPQPSTVPQVLPSTPDSSQRGGSASRERTTGSTIPRQSTVLRTAEIARLNREADPSLDRRPAPGPSTHTPAPSRGQGDGRDGRDRNGGRDRDGGHDRDGGRDWSRGRDWDRDRDHGQRSGSSWSVSIGIGGDGFGLGLGYSSGGWGSSRRWCDDPWDRWNWRPVCSPRYSTHWVSNWHHASYYRPLWCEPVWCEPFAVRSCTPSFWSVCWDYPDYCETGSRWAAVEYVQPQVVVYDAPVVTTYVNDAPQWVSLATPTAPVAGTYETRTGGTTVYRGEGDLGQMVWSAVPSSIIDSVLTASDSDRASMASRFLSRRPAGGWQLVVESQRRVGDIVWVQCRGVTTSQFGIAPTVRLAMPRELQGIRAGEQITATGRLTEVSVDDPIYPYGVLTLEEAEVAR